VVTDIPDLSAAWYGLALLGDGSFFAAGSTADADVRLLVARYDENGQLDDGFGDGGIALHDPAGDGTSASDLAVDDGGRVVVAGRTGAAGDPDFLVARFTADGDLDDSFGTDGATVVDWPGAEAQAWAQAVLLLEDGRALVAGAVSNGDPTDFALARVWP
jgi:uncharacterized delta-60 repeat protein